ncbi:hypothetical protein H0H92_014615 [Tricholoma furcatifolium]|nr:hypothetical protein H0H92_014615 [Tricholoma furcatifolium]
MQAVWARLREENPFCTMASLETLALKLPGVRLDVILSMDFPWHQIRFIEITWPLDKPPNPAMIVQALSKCRTLSRLELYSNKRTSSDLQNARFNDNFTHKELLDLNSLINLDVSGGLPSSIIKSIATSERLLTVTIWDAGIKLEVFYHILEHCPNLTSLECAISDTESARLLHAPIAAHLKHLTILRLDVFDPHQAHLSMVERRLELERGMGSINLRSIRGRVRDPSLLVYSSEARKNFITKVNLKQIKEKYGVYVKYDFRDY